MHSRLKDSRVVARIEPALHEKFIKAVSINNSTVSEVLRTFIYHYVEHVQPAQADMQAFLASLDDDLTRSQRVEIATFAEANTNLEGYQVSDMTKSLINDYINGERPIDAIIAESLKRFKA